MTTSADERAFPLPPAPLSAAAGTPAGDDPARLLDERSRLLESDRVRRPEYRVSLDWLDLLVRKRRLAFAVMGLVYLLSFNGLWRIGVDSALYRGLAHSLANGHGYMFAGEHHKHAFFGLPLMLAGCERVFGVTPVPGIILITLMALATLVLVDRMVRLRFPLWMATLVTLGLGLNFRFVRQSQELMTDVPFALGVVATLYGLDLLRFTPNRERAVRLGAGALFGVGLVLAAATRPTFGVLALALLISSVVRAITNRDGRRRLHIAICAAAVGVTLLLFLSDPRTSSFNPTEGIYEQELIERVRELPLTIYGQLDKFLSSNLNDAFFAMKMQPLGIPAAVLVLAGTIPLIRRDLTWGLMVIGLVLVTLPLSTVPRYYIMIMPMLWVGWLLLLARFTLASPPILRGAVMFVGVAVPLWINVGRVAGFVVDQRRPDVAWLLNRADRETTFYAKYRNGVVPEMAAIAKIIREHATPTQKVIGPNAHVLTYLSERRVVGERTVFESVENKITQYPAALKRYDPDLAIFPWRAYDESDKQLREMVRRRLLAPLAAPIAHAGDAFLAEADVRTPPPGENWKVWKAPPINGSPAALAATMPSKKKSSLAGVPASQRAEILARRQRKAELARREEVKARKAKAEAQARKERNAKREQQLKRDQQAKRDRVEAQAAKERKAAKERRAASQRAAGATSPPTTKPAAQP